MPRAGGCTIRRSQKALQRRCVLLPGPTRPPRHGPSTSAAPRGWRRTLSPDPSGAPLPPVRDAADSRHCRPAQHGLPLLPRHTQLPGVHSLVPPPRCSGCLERSACCCRLTSSADTHFHHSSALHPDSATQQWVESPPPPPPGTAALHSVGCVTPCASTLTSAPCTDVHRSHAWH